jgi:hypothetical protein
MALDTGMVGKQIQVGVAKLIEAGGQDIGFTARLTALLPPGKHVVWGATGHPWFSGPNEKLAPPGQEVVFFEVPCTDTGGPNGWIVGGKQLASGEDAFKYQVSVAISSRSGQRVYGPFVVHASDPDVIDIDRWVPLVI